MTEISFVDTHTHLDGEQFSDDLDDVIAEAVRVGVTTFINIGCDPKRWLATPALAARDPRIAYTLGLHPTSTDEWSMESFAVLRELVLSSEPVAIGEIGLDYYWTDKNKAEQRASFEAQIDLALEVDLPIVIHQRSAAEDVHDVLASSPDGLRAVLHSFDGDRKLGALARERGWLVGAGGLMTRRQNADLRTMLQSFPLDQIVLETDSPYLVPSGLKQSRNTPSSIPLIAERLAGLLGREVAEIAEETTANAFRFFGIKIAAVSR